MWPQETGDYTCPLSTSSELSPDDLGLRGPWWGGSPTLLSRLCGWQSRRGRERTKTGNNHKAIHLPDSERRLTWAPHATTNQLKEILLHVSPWAYGGLEGVGEARGRAKTRTQVLIDNLSQALSTVPRGKQGASPYLYQLTGVTVMGKEGGWGPASSSHCSLGCCWSECHLVFDWIPLSEVTCFLSQFWYLTMTFCLLPLALNHSKYTPGLPGGLKVKNPPAHVGTNPWVGKIPWRRKWHPTPVFLPGKSHGQRSLASYSPLGCKRVGHDSMTKQQQQQNMHSVKLTVLTVFSVGFCGIEHIHILCNIHHHSSLKPPSLTLIPKWTPALALKHWLSIPLPTALGIHCSFGFWVWRPVTGQSCEWNQTSFALLWLAYFTSLDVLKAHACSFVIHLLEFPCFWRLNSIPLGEYTPLGLSTHWSVDSWGDSSWGSCEWHFCGHEGTDKSSGSCFQLFEANAQKRNCYSLWDFHVFFFFFLPMPWGLRTMSSPTRN